MIQPLHPSCPHISILYSQKHTELKKIITAQQTLLKSCFHDMLRLRHFDQQAILLHRKGMLRTFPSCQGQEALSIGLSHAMRQQDVFCPYYRDHGTIWKRGATWEQLLLFWAGCEQGNLYCNQYNLPAAIPIASQCAHGVGAALAAKYKRTNQVAFVTLGDGATSKGDFYESINFAGSHKLPIVFVINNNQWAISMPRKTQTITHTLAQKAAAAGIGAIQCDGTDVLAVIQTAKEARKSALNGLPVLVEAISYRLSDHTTCDDASCYRDIKEHKKTLSKKDPLLNFEQLLLTHQIITQPELSKIKEKVTKEIDHAINQYLIEKNKLSQQPPAWQQALEF
jgi:2-oxoisovalerate dehydrogenase E1 component alpha subunit